MFRLSLVLPLAALLVPAAASAAAPVLPLPVPQKQGTVSVESALAARRSVRAFTNEALTVAELGQLLWAAQGVSGPDGKRTAPSARHLYPLELAVVVQNVEGLARGSYRYVPARHALELLAPARGGDPMLTRATSQPQVHAAPVVFVVAAVYERMDAGARSTTWTDYEAGLASENLLLQVVALRLAAVVVGGMDPAAVREAVRFTGHERVIVLIPAGHPAG
ncbi:SagB/ThcOx family dehydrogenase [Anaeromyxobacter oryzae]|uniref:Nitroreductase n=1 Tax=Anaeromyxobacter oryzae TaxID=2918170 RepID=A0ABM7X1C1_9BACT|nr:SagB/ThcOx family dehydrogenase [Anaeromyxobacter oryzae]BDG05596.1 nitroreductase [Anaeromyxobacter oryzae]